MCKSPLAELIQQHLERHLEMKSGISDHEKDLKEFLGLHVTLFSLVQHQTVSHNVFLCVLHVFISQMPST